MELPAQILGFPLKKGEPIDAKGLPFFFSTLFSIVEGSLGETECLFVMPRGEVKLTPLLKAVERLQSDFLKPCVVASDQLSLYQIQRLTEERIAWVASAERFFVPFLGLAVMSSMKKHRPKTRILSPQAQRVAGRILDQSWAGKSTSDVAALMEKSLPSVSNYFAEISARSPEVFVTEGRTRRISPLSAAQQREVWDKLKEALVSPCLERFYVKRPKEAGALGELCCARAGLTALSALTMLGDDPWPTYAMYGPDALDRLEAAGVVRVDEGDGPDALIELWSHDVETVDGFVRDVPLFLSLRDRKGEDPRLDEALEVLERRIGL